MCRIIEIDKILYYCKKIKNKKINCENCKIKEFKTNLNCNLELKNLKTEKVIIGEICDLFAKNKLIKINDPKEILKAKLNEDLQKYKIIKRRNQNVKR